MLLSFFLFFTLQLFSHKHLILGRALMVSQPLVKLQSRVCVCVCVAEKGREFVRTLKYHVVYCIGTMAHGVTHNIVKQHD